jgi:hypothetical protein
VPYPPFPVSSFGSDVVQVVGGFLWSAGPSCGENCEALGCLPTYLSVYLAFEEMVKRAG